MKRSHVAQHEHRLIQSMVGQASYVLAQCTLSELASVDELPIAQGRSTITLILRYRQLRRQLL